MFIKHWQNLYFFYESWRIAILVWQKQDKEVFICSFQQNPQRMNILGPTNTIVNDSQQVASWFLEPCHTSLFITTMTSEYSIKDHWVKLSWFSSQYKSFFLSLCSSWCHSTQLHVDQPPELVLDYISCIPWHSNFDCSIMTFTQAATVHGGTVSDLLLRGPVLCILYPLGGL